MSKIELENAIFARARKLGAKNCALEGSLNCSSSDLELQTLLYVYNANFHAQNYVNFCTPQEALESCQAYLKQRGGGRENLICSQREDFNFELLVSGLPHETNCKI